MSESAPHSAPAPLSIEQVRHVATLCRLQLSADQLESYRAQLSSILDHIAKLDELDVTDVEPLAHPAEMTNRLDEDQIENPMPIEQLFMNAPAVKAPYLAVPKVLTDG